MQRAGNHRSGQTSDEVATIISRYRASGLGLKRFAREHGLSPGQLHYWVYQVRPRKSARRRSPPVGEVIAPRFQEIQLSTRASLVESWAVEVSLPRGIAVRFNPTATAQWIGSVVQALERPC